MYWELVDLETPLEELSARHHLAMEGKRGALLDIGDLNRRTGKVPVWMTPLLPPIREHRLEFDGTQTLADVVAHFGDDVEVVTCAPFRVNVPTPTAPGEASRQTAADRAKEQDQNQTFALTTLGGGSVGIFGFLLKSPVFWVVFGLLIALFALLNLREKRPPTVAPRASSIEIRSFGATALDRHNVVQYARWRLEHPDLEPDGDLLSRAERALARIDDVREEYGQLKLDIVYHIDNPALFDGDCPTTAQFLAALWEAEHLREGVATSTVEELASKIEVAYAVAREHAERVGLQHLPKSKRADGRRASKAARLVTAGATEGERAAARTQLRSILESLALYYLPSVEEIRALEAPSEDAPVDTGR